jgi:hypothetical protein
MTLFEIDNRLVNLYENNVDDSTGEILEGADLDKAIDECQMDLNTKLSNIACYIKNLLSDAEQLKVEKDKLAQRQKACERKAENLKKYLDGYLHMTINERDLPKYKFSDSRCQISYRKSEAVEITDLDKVPKKFIKDRVLKETDVDKAEIKKLLKADSNVKIEGTQLVTRENIQIK